MLNILASGSQQTGTKATTKTHQKNTEWHIFFEKFAAVWSIWSTRRFHEMHRMVKHVLSSRVTSFTNQGPRDSRNYFRLLRSFTVETHLSCHFKVVQPKPFIQFSEEIPTPIYIPVSLQRQTLSASFDLLGILIDCGWSLSTGIVETIPIRPVAVSQAIRHLVVVLKHACQFIQYVKFLCRRF